MQIASRGHGECASDRHAGDRVRLVALARRPCPRRGTHVQGASPEASARVGLNMRSGRVIGTYRSSFGEEDLSGIKSLDKIHEALAARARPCGWLREGGCICCWRRLVEQAAAERKQTSTGAVGQPAEVADAGEASGQHMLEEAAQELLRRERHGAMLTAMRIVLPAEGDRGI